MFAVPLFIGWLMIGALVVVQAAAITGTMRLLQRETRREGRPIRWLRGVSIFSRAMLLMVLAQLVEIAVWAALFLAVGEFSDLPTAFYYSAVNFTTLGYGDIVMSREWRLLGPLEAVAGMLMFGISTAVLFAVIQTLTRLRDDGVGWRRGSDQRSEAIHFCIVATLALLLGHAESPGGATVRPDRGRITASIKQLASGLVAVVLIWGCLTPLRSYAGDEVQDARVHMGQASYDKYCTSCHGPGGVPGSAVFAATKKPVDLRTIAQRNGGDFPSIKWWDFVFSSQPRGVHAEAWERIRNDQTETVEVERDVAAHGVAANIEYYVESLQNKTK